MRRGALLLGSILVTLVAVILVGCAMPGIHSDTRDPTMTAIPLPSDLPERLTATALILRAAVTVPTGKSTHTPTATEPATRQPTYPPVVCSPTATITASAAPSPSPTATVATPTPQPNPAQSKPRPTPTSQLKGKLVLQTTIGDFFYTINANGSGLRPLTDGVDPT
jgi:hypothetical protein